MARRFHSPSPIPPGRIRGSTNSTMATRTSAFNFGNVWYAAGQGLHFGVDFDAPCGTPVHAIADGVVQYVDAAGFGAGPHSLVIDHPGTGYSSLYGHLLQVPQFVRGDEVKRGDPIGLSGDPDGSCGSRPHLHLEIRSADYQTTYNPLPLLEGNWHMLTSIGPIANTFEQDLDHPYRWMKLEDQPDVTFGRDILNNYTHPWPPKLENRPPANTPARRHLDPLPEETTFTRQTVSLNRWNINAWWKPTDTDAVYLIDAVPGQPTGVFRQPLDGSERTYIETAPPTLLSPDGSVTVDSIGGGSFRITRLSDSQSWDDIYERQLSSRVTRWQAAVVGSRLRRNRAGPGCAGRRVLGEQPRRHTAAARLHPGGRLQHVARCAPDSVRQANHLYHRNAALYPGH